MCLRQRGSWVALHKAEAYKKVSAALTTITRNRFLFQHGSRICEIFRSQLWSKCKVWNNTSKIFVPKIYLKGFIIQNKFLTPPEAQDFFCITHEAQNFAGGRGERKTLNMTAIICENKQTEILFSIAKARISMAKWHIRIFTLVSVSYIAYIPVEGTFIELCGYQVSSQISSEQELIDTCVRFFLSFPFSSELKAD